MNWDEGLEYDSAAHRFAASNAKRIRVLAGPGAGKSFALKRRLLRILENHLAEPEKVLVLSFTGIAAADLKNDVQNLHANGADRIEVNTLHGLCGKLLTARGQMSERECRPLLDHEKRLMLHDILPELPFREKSKLLTELESADPSASGAELAEFSRQARLWTERHGGFLPGELVRRLYDYLRANGDARRELAYDYVMADEYQDLNSADQALIELLVSENGSLAVIGDDDQSIYGFRHASPDGIRNFLKKFPDAEDISFDVCFRCPEKVLDMANRLIGHSASSPKSLLKPRPGIAEGIVLSPVFASPEEEIAGLCELIKSNQWNPSDVVILTPVRGRSRTIVDALRSAGIPAASGFRDGVFDSWSAREGFAWLCVLADSADDAAWRVLLGGEKYDYRAKSCRRATERADKLGIRAWEVLKRCADKEMTLSHVTALVRQFARLREKCQSALSDPDAFLLSRAEGDYQQILAEALSAVPGTEADRMRRVRDAVLDRVFALRSTHVENAVRVMSLHAAKGLSARAVIIASAVDDLIPLKGQKEAEQRRLFYVAVTRCKGDSAGKEGNPGTLVVSRFSAFADGTYAEPSRFLAEMGMNECK